MNKEIWKDIPNYEGLYQASSLGRIKSLNFNGTGKEKIMRPRTGNRYYMIALWKDRKRKDLLLHRVIAETFIENKENKPFVNHKDENCFNNSVNNLMWCTHKENMNWGTRNERISKHSSKKRKINQYDLNDNFIKQWNCIKDYFDSNNMKYKTGIIECCKGRKKTAYGYKWEYSEVVDNVK